MISYFKFAYQGWLSCLEYAFTDIQDWLLFVLHVSLTSYDISTFVSLHAFFCTFPPIAI